MTRPATRARAAAYRAELRRGLESLAELPARDPWATADDIASGGTVSAMMRKRLVIGRFEPCGTRVFSITDRGLAALAQLERDSPDASNV